MVFPSYSLPSFSVFYKKTVKNCKLGCQITLLTSIDTKYLLLGQILRRFIFFFGFSVKYTVKFMGFFFLI